MQKFLCLVLSVFTMYIPAFAGAGSTGFAFLKTGAGARASALGSAYSAVSDDVTGIYWNPAGTASVNTRQVHLSHHKWIEGVNSQVAAFILPTSKGSIGLGLMLNNVNGFERRTIASTKPLGEFSAHDFVFLVSYARNMSERFSVGMNIKYLHEKIYVETASGLVVDIGTKFLLLKSGLYLSAVIQNLGSTSELYNEKIELPKTIRVGSCYDLPFDFLNGTWLFTADYVQYLKDTGYYHFGGEYATYNFLALRLGYQAGYDVKGATFGFGLFLKNFNLDYAYVPFDDDLGNSQRFSLTANF